MYWRIPCSVIDRGDVDDDDNPTRTAEMQRRALVGFRARITSSMAKYGRETTRERFWLGHGVRESQKWRWWLASSCCQPERGRRWPRSSSVFYLNERVRWVGFSWAMMWSGVWAVAGPLRPAGWASHLFYFLFFFFSFFGFLFWIFVWIQSCFVKVSYLNPTGIHPRYYKYYYCVIGNFGWVITHFLIEYYCNLS
jgi:hypothetical protein